MIHCVINLYAAMDFLKPQLTSMTHAQLKHDLFMEKFRVTFVIIIYGKYHGQ